MEARAYLLPAVAILGLAVGFGMSRIGDGDTTASPAPAAVPAAKVNKGGKAGPAEEHVTLVKPAALPRSTDTVETLLALKWGELYPRLGLWLLDASEEDMNAFWEGYKDREDLNDTIKDLVFTQWGKKNAAGMLECARRTGCEISSMWSWAMSDPQGMLAFIDGKSERIRNYGLRGLATFHPELALQMLEKDPSLAGIFEMEQLGAQLAKGDREKEIEFMSKNGNGDYYARSILKKWAAEDPHRAFEWFQSHGGGEDYERTEFLTAIKAQHPEVLQEIAAGLSPGSLRRELELAAFMHLAEKEPEKALEEARKIEAPRLAAERLAAAGKAMVAQDPAAALGVLGELFGSCPDASYRGSAVTYPNGSSSSGGGVAGVHEFLAALTAWDPRQTMDAVLAIPPGSKEAPDDPFFVGSGNRSAATVAQTWAQQDPAGMSQWYETQQDPALRDMAASALSEQFRRKENIPEALDWAMRLSDSRGLQRQQLSNILGSWAYKDREGALRWFEQAELSEQTRQQLKGYFPRNNEEQ